MLLIQWRFILYECSLWLIIFLFLSVVTPHVVIFNCTKNQSIFAFWSLQIGRATEAPRVANQVTTIWKMSTQLSLAELFTQWFTDWSSLQAAEQRSPLPPSSCCSFLSNHSTKNIHVFRTGYVAPPKGSLLFVATCTAGWGDSTVTNSGGGSPPWLQFPSTTSSALQG